MKNKLDPFLDSFPGGVECLQLPKNVVPGNVYNNFLFAPRIAANLHVHVKVL